MQAYLGGELICTIAQSQTVGLPLALAVTVKGLFVGLLIEHPANIADMHPMTGNRISLRKLLPIKLPFPSKAGSANFTYAALPVLDQSNAERSDGAKP